MGALAKRETRRNAFYEGPAMISRFEIKAAITYSSHYQSARRVIGGRASNGRLGNASAASIAEGPAILGLHANRMHNERSICYYERQWPPMLLFYRRWARNKSGTQAHFGSAS